MGAAIGLCAIGMMVIGGFMVHPGLGLLLLGLMVISIIDW